VIDLALENELDDAAAERAELVAIRRTGSRPPLFLIRTWRGELVSQRALARRLGPEQPIYSIAPPHGNEPADFPVDANAWADFALAQLLRIPHTGPYLLGGWSFGGVIALEVGERLVRKSAEVALVAMLDSRLPKARPPRRRGRERRSSLHKTVKALDRYLSLTTAAEKREFRRERAARRREKFAARWNRLRGRAPAEPEVVSIATPGIEPEDATHVTMTGRRMSQLQRAIWVAYLKYRPTGSALPVLQLRTAQSEAAAGDAALGWAPWLHGDLESARVPGEHMTLFEEPHVAELAPRLADALARASARSIPSI
jgi:thioesterase domain-containing protein